MASLIAPCAFADEDYAADEEMDVVGYYIPDEKKETTQISNVLTFEQIAKTGDANASDALQRVSGLSISNDKKIIVRGLDDRYSKTLLDGSELPSPEPNKRVAPLELFPTNFMESILVQKTWSPNFPGEYAGGLIEMRSKTLPDLPFWKLDGSLGAVLGSSFTEGQTYEAGGLDFFGFDDGSRELPSNPTEGQPFSANLLPITQTNLPSLGLGASYGNRWDIGLNSYGVVAAISSKSKTVNQNESHKAFSVQGSENKSYQYDKTTQSSDVNVLVSSGVELGFDHSIKSTLMYLHNGSKTTATKTGNTQGEGYDETDTRLQFVERTIMSAQLEGDHYLPITDASKLTWRANVASGKRAAPDQINYLYADENENGEQTLQLESGISNFRREFSTINDIKYNVASQLDFPFLMQNREARIYTGADFSFQDQQNDSQRFTISLNNNVDYLDQDINSIIADEHFTNGDMEINEITNTSDSWSASKMVVSGYGQAEIPVSAILSFTAGARYEYMNQNVQSPHAILNDTLEESTISQGNFLPALTSTVQVNENIQLRGAYSRTLARPSFQEMSRSPFYDIEGGSQFRGNPALKVSNIDNIDTRLEWYGEQGDSWSFGAFYKNFTNPMERTIAASSDNFITIENIDSALNYGGEIEMTQHLNFLSDRLANIYVSGNFAYIKSSVDLGANKGSATNAERPMQGQSDILANIQFGYENIDTGMNATFAYNYTGDRIAQTGADGLADVIEEGYGSLDFNFKTRIPGWTGYKTGFKVKNLIPGTHRFSQNEHIIREYKDEIDLSISFSKSWEDLPVDIYADE